MKLGNELYRQLQGHFEDKIECPCGNTDWKEFLYVVIGESIAAGCKKCGSVQSFDSKTGVDSVHS